MAFFSVLLILGIRIPLVVLVMSSIELALATDPVVLMATDCELAFGAAIATIAIAATRRRNLVMFKQLSFEKKILTGNWK